MELRLELDRGSLVAPTVPPEDELLELFVRDERLSVYRASAHFYRTIVLRARRLGVTVVDRARAFEPLPLPLARPITPLPHQARALEEWSRRDGTGIVVLPTGAGKTILAVLAMAKVERPTLVVAPTIDLIVQWQRTLASFFDRPIGMLGGGESDLQAITVATYDSAAARIEWIGGRFGFLVADECHHLPAPAYRFIAAAAIAPFRLGLTATLERPDGLESTAIALMGSVRYRVEIDELEGRYLAPYEVETIKVELTPDELERYEAARAQYLGFLRASGLAGGDFAAFVAHCHRSTEGRAAFLAYREQRRIALTAESKLEALWDVLLRHRGDRVIVFTNDNDTVYRLSQELLFPVITHHTKAGERKQLLADFSSGRLPVLLTSKVLNEGVDVPEANVGVVLSGSGSVREHVQRLGRILRHRDGKRAILYEILSDVAAETGQSERRRQHRAYARFNAPC